VANEEEEDKSSPKSANTKTERFTPTSKMLVGLQNINFQELHLASYYTYLTYIFGPFFWHGSTAPVGLGLLIFKVS